MNVRDVLLESILATIEEEQAADIEKDIIDDMISRIQSIKYQIQLTKESLLKN